MPSGGCQEEQKGHLQNGVRSMTVSSWSDFQRAVEKLQKKKDYIWRGQGCDWDLLSSFDRVYGNVGNEERDKKLEARLNKWKDMVRTQCRLTPVQWKDNEYWAIGQHYGLKTPLLDWTACPFVAAYFALRNSEKPQARNRVVYGLNRGLKRLVCKIKKRGEVVSRNRYVEFLGPLSTDDSRVVSQRGRFTKALNGVDIETNVKKYEHKRRGQTVLVKIEIPEQCREEFLKSLEQIGIKEPTLLPDLDKVARSCNLELEIDN